MAEEMQAHVDLLTERNIFSGMSPHEARNAALREFGGVEQIKEVAREQRTWRWADEFLQDLRFGARMLWRTPGFSILAILCLTLGIGTNAAVLSWIEGILVRPYPLVAHQDRMFALNATTRGQQGYTGLSYPEFLDYEKSSTLLDSFGNPQPMLLFGGELFAAGRGQFVIAGFAVVIGHAPFRFDPALRF